MEKIKIELDEIKLHAGDILIIDPCYIKHVEGERYDMLKLEKVLHEGDDGEFAIRVGQDKQLPVYIGVDSGRIWALRAEFDGRVVIDAGLSGYCVRNKDTDLSELWVED